MLLSLLQFFASKFLLLALHLEAGSFPRPLTAKEEIETFAALRAGDSTAGKTHPAQSAPGGSHHQKILRPALRSG